MLSDGNNTYVSKLPHTPTTWSMRKFMQSLFRTSADFDAFCIDSFPSVYREFSSDMRSSTKHTILLNTVSSKVILESLSQSYPVDFDRCSHLLVYSDAGEFQFGEYSSRDRRNRLRMLEKINDMWINGELRRSVSDNNIIQIDKQFRFDILGRPGDIVLTTRIHSEIKLPASTEMIDVFDELCGEMLILGPPGSGKTTALLQLVDCIIQRARQDERYPIPVVFNLSTWTERDSDLSGWLMRELTKRYDVPPKVGNRWMKSSAIIPMLDGLDEVRENLRYRCIRAINQFRAELTNPAMVICSRIDEYVSIGEKLNLEAAVVLLPLTDKQIDDYLEGQVGKSNSLLQRLHGEDIREMMRTPLFLAIMANLLQRDKGSFFEARSPFVTGCDIRTRIIDEYIRHSVNTSDCFTNYDRDSSMGFLRNLARIMQVSGSAIFHIEHMQPAMLRTIGVRSPILLRLAAVCNLNPFIVLYVLPFLFLPLMLCSDIVVGLSIGAGLVIMCLKVSPIEQLRLSINGISGRIKHGIFSNSITKNFAAGFGLVMPLVFGLLRGFQVIISKSSDFIQSIWLKKESLGFGICSFFLSVIIVYLFLLKLKKAQSVLFVWASMFCITAAAFILYDIFQYLRSISPVVEICVLIFVIICDGIFLIPTLFLIYIGCALFASHLLSVLINVFTVPEISIRSRPNEGIVRSWRSAVFSYLFYILAPAVIGLLYDLFIHIMNNLNGKHIEAYSIASNFSRRMFTWNQVAAVLGLYFGGMAALQHYYLRLLLFLFDVFPLRLCRFFNEMSRLVFLRRVGGGYSFAHRLILEHLAKDAPHPKAVECINL